jgi:hypothetical protein
LIYTVLFLFGFVVLWFLGLTWLAACWQIKTESASLASVLAVHLEHRSEAVRVESARMIVALAKAKPIPLIAAGDFNSTPADFPAGHRIDSFNPIRMPSGRLHFVDFCVLFQRKLRVCKWD